MPQTDITVYLDAVIQNITARLRALETQEDAKYTIQSSTPTSDLTLTTSFQDVPSVSMTLTPGLYLLNLVMQADIEAGEFLLANVRSDGADITPALAAVNTQNMRLLVPAEETRTLTVQARKSGGAGVSTIGASSTHLMATRISTQ